MPSLLITVFIIQLLCHLVQTVGAKPINDLVCPIPSPCHFPSNNFPSTNNPAQLWQLYTRLPLQSNKDLLEQTRLRREVVRLKREMNAVSAQDEFSKWAKLRRQHDKAMEEYDKKGTRTTAHQGSLFLHALGGSFFRSEPKK